MRTQPDEVCFPIDDGRGYKVAEAGVIELRATLGSGDDGAMRTGKLVQKRPAGRRAVDDCQRSLDRFEPGGQFRRRKIRAAKIEFIGGLA